MLTTTTEILNEFYTLIGDTAELSSDELLKLLNKIYREVLADRQWEILKKEATGSVNGTEIAAPDDFSNLLADKPKIYLGTNNIEFTVVPFEDRRLHRNQNHIAYYDARQEKFVFPVTQSDTYSFDYIYTPETITSVVTPVFPNRFWNMFPFFMASDNDFLQMMEKSRSYAAENRARGTMILNDMRSWDSRLTNMSTYGN